MTLAPQAPIGAYVLERRLALGGMAEVWSATRPGDPSGRRYALKVLLDHHARDPKMCTMFADEARIAGRLHHPNIVRVEELVVAGAVHAQVMPLVEGRDLRRVLQAVIGAGEVVPVAVAAAVGREVARALAYAHAAVADDGQPLELVHRDVSPHNVMLTVDGRVLLLDFGVALARERSTKTSQGTVKGKLAYMAPEQLDPGRGPVSAQADVWSLGVVLWELLAARRLYGSRDGVELVHAVTSEVAEPVTRYRADVPARLAGLIAAMLTREVEARAASMEAVIEALDGVVAGADAALLAAWAAPYVGAPARRTGVFLAPAQRAAVAPEADDTVRPTDEGMQATAPEAASDAASRPTGSDRERSTDGVAVRGPVTGGAPTAAEPVASETRPQSDARTVGLEALAAPTTALPAVSAGDLADTHPEEEGLSASVSGPVLAQTAVRSHGYDVVHAGQLAPPDQLAATRAHVVAPRTDEAPTRLDLSVGAEPAPTVPVEVAPTRLRVHPPSGPERLEAPTRPVLSRDDVVPTVATATPRPSPALAPTAASATPRPGPALAPTAALAAPGPGPAIAPTEPLVIEPRVEQSSIIRPRPLVASLALPRALEPDSAPKRRSPVRVVAWVVGGATLGVLLVQALRLWI